ncbi:MAG TPA: intradiol ring-cleavage dioxygenase [Vicinamibacterales bacterium]|jgi:protocatechuate 3,4-dioxygenase beta subunit|nr:intradiol ring-cleavage dioxygenase [Vicinamibacterales bacterium]
MDDDDVMVGRLLTRREVVALLGMSGVAALGEPLMGGQSPAKGARALPACVVQPEQTEGPYFVDKMLHRADIRKDPSNGAVSPGAPLTVAFMVSRVAAGGACVPVAGAQVDLWQCDAAGVYSGVKDANFDTMGRHFLRGHQLTDANGKAAFVTIYPGWYPGRAVHLHFKIRTTPAAAQGYEFTSQLYFDEALTDRVFARAPYSTRTGQRRRNEEDRIFQSGGKQLVMPVSESADGYSGEFSLALSTPGS